MNCERTDYTCKLLENGIQKSELRARESGTERSFTTLEIMLHWGKMAL